MCALVCVCEPSSCGWILSVSGSGVELGELMEQQRVAFPDEDTPHIITVLSTALLRAGMAWPGHTVAHTGPAHMLPYRPCAFPTERAYANSSHSRCVGRAFHGLLVYLYYSRCVGRAFNVLFVPVPSRHGLQRTAA